MATEQPRPPASFGRPQYPSGHTRLSKAAGHGQVPTGDKRSKPDVERFCSAVWSPQRCNTAESLPHTLHRSYWGRQPQSTEAMGLTEPQQPCRARNDIHSLSPEYGALALGGMAVHGWAQGTHKHTHASSSQPDAEEVRGLVVTGRPRELWKRL